MRKAIGLTLFGLLIVLCFIALAVAGFYILFTYTKAVALILAVIFILMGVLPMLHEIGKEFWEQVIK